MATYRIYPSATPAGGGNADNYVWLGVEFYVTSACNLDAILWYQPASGTTNTQNRKGYLYQGDSLIGTVVAGPTAIAAPSGTGWQRLALTPSYALTPNTRYRAVIGHPNGGYPADANYFSSGPGGSGIRAWVRSRASVFSRLITRGSAARRGCSCPCPTSTA